MFLIKIFKVEIILFSFSNYLIIQNIWSLLAQKKGIIIIILFKHLEFELLCKFQFTQFKVPIKSKLFIFSIAGLEVDRSMIL